MTRPPRLALCLLTLRLRAEWCEFVIGDLEEEWMTRNAESPVAATVWIWWQTLRCLVAPPRVYVSPSLRLTSRGDSGMRTFAADFRHSLRTMRRAPAFAVAVVSVLALGIGANTAIFSIVNAVLLRTLPFKQPERLVRLYTMTPGGRPFEVSPGKFYDWQRSARSFEGMALYSCCGFREIALSDTGAARSVNATAVGAGFFEVLGATPMLGRTFRREEDAPGNRVTLISERFWRTEFGGDADIIGRTVRLDDEAYTVIGVIPASFSVASWTGMASDVWIPLALTNEERVSRGNHNLEAVARLDARADVAQAQSEMDAISARLARENGKLDQGWGAVVRPMQDAIVGDSRTMLLMLLGAVGLFLLVACANVGNLLFARTLSQRKEIAIRVALGAPRARVVRQLLTEALVLAAAGGALGLLLAYGSLDAASPLLAGELPRGEQISIDARVLMFAVAVSIVTGMLAGTLPAVRATRSEINDVLKAGGRGGGAAGLGTRRLLIVCEVALSLVLLMGAGVMARSLFALRYGDPGFDPNNVLAIDVRLIDVRYPTPQRKSMYFDAALQRIRALPGVVAAGTIDDVPLNDGSSQTLQLEGHAPQRVAVQVRQITPGYLRAMRIPLLRGRDVAENDGEVLLVSREAAKLYWGTDDPIGHRASLPSSSTVFRRVVGIVGDVKQRSLTEAPTPTLYFYSHEPYGRATFVVRAAVPVRTMASSVVSTVRAIDPGQPVGSVRTMVQAMDQGLTSQRFSALLLGIFGGIALVLASVGIYSVLSYIVRGRSREIGIRTALGAGTSDVLRLVLVEGMSPALAGIAIGAIGALASARILASLIFGVSAADPLTLAVVAATLAVVALLSSLVPAWRASRVDPVRALRSE
jgi:putative ABC transport system permease protein